MVGMSTHYADRGSGFLLRSGLRRLRFRPAGSVTRLTFGQDQRDPRRSRRAFPMTETELKLMAAAAIMGLRRRPENG